MFLQITLGEIIDQASLQWHSRLARRTYKSVLTKKCEGREFEPPLEQDFKLFLQQCLCYIKVYLLISYTNLK